MKDVKFFINNPESMKEIAENIFLDVHGNVFVFDKDAYLSSYEDDGVNLRVMKHPNKYTTVIINIEDAYNHFFGGEKKPEITIVKSPYPDDTINSSEEPDPMPKKQKLGSDAWVKDPNARYNYRALKDAYLAVIRDGWSMTDAAEASGVKGSTLSQMCCKKVHVAFTDALDDEFGLTPHRYTRRHRRDSTESTMENVYIEYHILHSSREVLSSKYKLSLSTIDRIINGTTKKAQKMIQEITKSGRFVEAKKKFEAMHNDTSDEEVSDIA